MLIERSNKLQLHYYFKDNSHTINAIVRNECEKELLHIFDEISNSLGFSTDVETEPTSSGGFKEIWEFIGENENQITLIVSIAAILISRFIVENKKLSKLQIENLELDNSIKKKELQQLKLNSINDEDLNDQKIKDTVEYLLKNYRITWRKSNFYKKLENYQKVEYISVQRFVGSQPVGSERLVHRKNFPDFILKSDELPPIENINIKIDVISPALKSGKFTWKGFIDKDIITFEMSDEVFKADVLMGKVHFSNSFAIEGNLVQYRKIEQDGSIKVIRNIVTLVTAKIEGGKRTAILHG